MRLTTKMRYGTRGLLDLALRNDDSLTRLRDIAERQGISGKYLEQVFMNLSAAGLVRAVRGPLGGYRLARPPAEITLRQIYDVLEGSHALVDCTSDPEACERAGACVTQQVWAEMYQVCMEALDSVTLADLVQRAERLNG